MRFPTAKTIDQFPCFLGESIYAMLGFADLLLGLDNRRTAFEFNDTFCHSTALASEAK